MENKNLAPHEPVVREGGPTPSNATAEPSAAFTPGPWIIYPDAAKQTVCVARGDGSHHRVAYVDFATNPIEFGDPREGLTETIAARTAANARLIAAAPDLLEALKNLWLRTTVGSDAERVAALTVAGDLLARLGALEATGADQ